jgi:hypothetical protein
MHCSIYRIDNSEYMRNGDYPPSRFDAQRDGLSAVFEAKINSNPENTAGVMTMAGRRFVLLQRTPSGCGDSWLTFLSLLIYAI